MAERPQNKHLKSYVKGDKRASAGGKKSKRGRSIKTIIKELLDAEYDTPEDLKKMFPNTKYTGSELATMAMLIKTTAGDVSAFNALLDQTEGKPKQTIEGEFDNHMTIEVIE